MTRGAVREPRGTRPTDRRDRSCRELRDVRLPSQPGVRVERVLVCPSGIHVVTSVPASSAEGTPPLGLLAAGRAAGDVVAGLLPTRYRDRVRPVLCRLDAPPMAELVDGVLVTTPRGALVRALAAAAAAAAALVGGVAGLEGLPLPW